MKMNKDVDGCKKIRYIFRLADGQEEVFDLSIDNTTLLLKKLPLHPVPHWVRLGFYQCPHCPFAEQQMECCPAALALAGVASSFEGTVSYDPVHVTVVTEQRTIQQQTTAQRAIGSMMGVLIAASGCPHANFLKPMARFHLPLSDGIETLYRVASMYLLGQYFITSHGGEADMKLTGLVRLYENLQRVNFGLADRLREATRTDSSINAIVCLDVFTRTVPSAIEDFLQGIEPLFGAYLENLPKKV